MIPRFSVRQLLLLTSLFALHFALRSAWIASRSPSHGGLIPLTLAAVVAAYCGWTLRGILVGGGCAAGIGLIAAIGLAADSILESPSTDFLRHHPIDSQYAADIELNAIAAVVVTIICFIGGLVVSFVSRTVRQIFAPPCSIPDDG